MASTDEGGLSKALVVNKDEGTVNVTVGGTIKVEGDADQAVVFVGVVDEHDENLNVNINAWKIEAPTTGKSVVILQGKIISEQNELENPEQLINYIIKANAVKKNDYASLGINLLNPTGTAKFNDDGDYSTIKGGSTLNFRVDAPAGKKVKAVYGCYEDSKDVVVAEADATESLLTKNADGTYSLKVRPGGGIMLYVEYEDAEEEKEPEEQDEQQEDPQQDEQEEETAVSSSSSAVTSTTTVATTAAATNAESDSAHVQLASTGEAVVKSNTLPATGDAASMFPAAMAAIVGAGAITAGCRSRKE